MQNKYGIHRMILLSRSRGDPRLAKYARYTYLAKAASRALHLRHLQTELPQPVLALGVIRMRPIPAAKHTAHLRHGRSHLHVLEELAPLALPHGRGRGPDLRGGALRGILHLAHDGRALREGGELVGGHELREVREDAPRVHGDGAHAARPVGAVQAVRGPHHGRLGLPVGHVRLVAPREHADVGEVRPRGRVPVGRGRHPDHARVEGGRAAGEEGGEEEGGQGEVREVVHGELALEAVGC